MGTCVIIFLAGPKLQYAITSSSNNGKQSIALEIDPIIPRLLFGRDIDIGTSEDTAASAEHFNIISSIINCLKLKDYTDYDSLPNSLQRQFVLPQRFKRYVSSTQTTTGAERTVTIIPGYFRSITELSSLISDRRGQLAASMQGSRLLMQQFQIAAILVGIITTILVGVKSGAKHPRVLDILAIISAAIGTGIASLIAFYNPREEYIRTARAISQLSQLQAEISFLLGSEKACDAAEPNNAKQVSDWFGRFSNITTASENFGSTEAKEEPTTNPPLKNQ
jgi:hypothetical protein